VIFQKYIKIMLIKPPQFLFRYSISSFSTFYFSFHLPIHCSLIFFVFCYSRSFLCFQLRSQSSQVPTASFVTQYSPQNDCFSNVLKSYYNAYPNTHTCYPTKFSNLVRSHPYGTPPEIHSFKTLAKFPSSYIELGSRTRTWH